MKNFLLSITLIVLTILTAPLNAAELKPFNAEYSLHRNGKHIGTGIIELQKQSADSWILKATSRGESGLAGLLGASLDEVSTFRMVQGKPELESYSYVQDLGFKKKRRNLQRNGDSIVADDGKNKASLIAEAGLVDRNLITLALRLALDQANHPLSFRVAERTEIQSQNYRRDGEELLKTAVGEFNAVKLQRVRENKSRETTVWFASTAGLMPLRTLQVEPNGETLELRLEKLR